MQPSAPRRQTEFLEGFGRGGEGHAASDDAMGVLVAHRGIEERAEHGVAHATRRDRRLIGSLVQPVDRRGDASALVEAGARLIKDVPEPRRSVGLQLVHRLDDGDRVGPHAAVSLAGSRANIRTTSAVDVSPSLRIARPR